MHSAIRICWRPRLSSPYLATTCFGFLSGVRGRPEHRRFGEVRNIKGKRPANFISCQVGVSSRCLLEPHHKPLTYLITVKSTHFFKTKSVLFKPGPALVRGHSPQTNPCTTQTRNYPLLMNTPASNQCRYTSCSVHWSRGGYSGHGGHSKEGIVREEWRHILFRICLTL